MLYKRFGKTQWQVSAIGQGCWNIGNQWGLITDTQANDIMMAAYDNGMNMFDVAESYGIPNGLSEIRLGKVLKEIRNNVYITSKIGHWGKRTGQGIPKNTVDMIRECGHACAGRLRTEYIDAMLCHEDDIEDPSVYIEGFKRLKEEGFIREYGISTNSFEIIKNFYNISNGECAIVELEYSLINIQPEEDILPFCKEHDIAVLVRSPMAMGILSGKYDLDSIFTDEVRESWNKGEIDREGYEKKIQKLERIRKIVPLDDIPETAIRYVISGGDNIVAIPGATKVEQVLSNARAGNRLLDKKILDILKTI